MRIQDNGNSFTIWISAKETYSWARKWPCSTLSNKRIRASFDRGGLVDVTVDGFYNHDFDGHEFSALVSDFAKKKLPKEHPCYFVVVGQKPILMLSQNGDPYGRGFTASESKDGGKTWFYRGDKGAMSRRDWRNYARKNGFVLKEYEN